MNRDCVCAQYARNSPLRCYRTWIVISGYNTLCTRPNPRLLAWTLDTRKLLSKIAGDR